MTGNNRGAFLVCLAGLAALFTAWGHGYYLAALNYPEEQRHQPYRYAADEPAKVDLAGPAGINAQPYEYRTPCDYPKGRDESDLCAQWRAAKAAEDGAFWTKLGVWVGFGGMIGLFWTLYYTRKAVEDTGSATRAMIRQNEISEAAQRPFVVVAAGPSPTLRNDRGYVMPASYRYENYGGTPAKIIRQGHTVEVIDEPNSLPRPLSLVDFGRTVPVGEVIGANEKSEFSPAGPIISGFSGSDHFAPPAKLTGIYKKHTFFHGFVIYEDMEERCYVTGFCFKYENGRFALIHASPQHNYNKRCNKDGSEFCEP